MAYAKDIFEFLIQTVKPIYKIIIAENFNAVQQIIKQTEKCKVDMQIAWLKLKAL